MSRPDAGGEAGEVGGAERGGVEHLGALDGQPERVGLRLEEDVVARRAAVGAQRCRRRMRRVGAERVVDLATAPRDALEDRTHDVRARARAREPADHRPRAGVEVRRAEPLERGDRPHAAAVRHRRGEGAGLGGVGDDAEAVAQPEHGRARGDRRALEAVGAHAVALPEHQRIRAVHREERLGPDVQVEHRRGAVGDLHLARRQPELPHRRRLLVADDGRERRRARARPRRRGRRARRPSRRSPAAPTPGCAGPPARPAFQPPPKRS